MPSLSLSIFGREVFAVKWTHPQPPAPPAAATDDTATDSSADKAAGSGLGGAFERSTAVASGRAGFGFRRVE